jgi:hypothetical protein
MTPHNVVAWRLFREVGWIMADYRKDAYRCYGLAKQMAKTEDLHAFLEMAQTWEKLASLHELSQRLTSSGVLFKKPAVRAE